MITSLLIDLDGTLWDTSKIHEQAYRMTFSKFKSNPEFEYESVAGRSTNDVMHEIGRQLKLRDDTIKGMVKFKQQKVRDILDEISQIPVFPNVRENLIELSNFFTLALCTSASRETTNIFLNSIGVLELFSCVLTSESVVESKPSPEIYNQAMLKLNANPSKCIVVEDSRAGVMAGVNSYAWVSFISYKESPVIADLDIEPWLRTRIKHFEAFSMFVKHVIEKRENETPW